MTQIIVNNVVDDNVDGLHNIVIHASVSEPISASDPMDLLIMLEHELTTLFQHDYNIFIEGKSINKDFFREFINNIFTQIKNLTIVYKIGNSDDVILELVKNNISITNGLTNAIVDVMF